MKTFQSVQKLRACVSRAWADRLSIAALVILGLLAAPARANDSTEFFAALTNAADTNGWIQSIPYADVQGSFAITSEGYRLHAFNPSGGDVALIDAYPATPVYTNCQVSLDVVDWNRNPWPSSFCSINLFARAQSFNGPTGTGYLFYFRPNGDTSDDGMAAAGIFRVDSGSVTFNQGGEFPINTNDQFRLVFTVNETNLIGQIFDLANLASPVFTFQTTDDRYTAAGSVGIFADDDAAVEKLGNLPVDFTVRNFRAGPPAPVLAIQQTVTVSWPDSYAGYLVQSAASPAGPWQPLNVTPQDSAGMYTVTVPTANTAQFFQLYHP